MTCHAARPFSCRMPAFHRMCPRPVARTPLVRSLLLSWTLWLYSGFSWLGVMAGEVERPRSTYSAVLLVLIPLVTSLNLLPFLVSLSLDPKTSHYSSGYFNVLAGNLAGDWLRVCFIIGANVSLLGLYHSQIIAADRTLFAFWIIHGRAVDEPVVGGVDGGVVDADEVCAVESQVSTSEDSSEGRPATASRRLDTSTRHSLTPEDTIHQPIAP